MAQIAAHGLRGVDCVSQSEHPLPQDDLERLTADHRQLQALIPAWIEYFQQHGVAAPPALQIELQKLLPRDSS